MSLSAILLWLGVAVQFVGGRLPWIVARRGLIWGVVGGLLGWQLWHDALLESMVPLYVLLGFLFTTHLVSKNLAGKRKRSWAKVLGTALGLFLLFVPVVETTLLPFNTMNYRQRTWTVAFENLHHTLQKRYAFGEWKEIDWDRLYAEQFANVSAAEAAGDEQAYYVALRNYLFELPDGHVWIEGPWHDEIQTAVIGGGFGFAVVKLDDGRVIAHIVETYGPAAQAGMHWGAEILMWDGVDIQTAVSNTPITWASRPPATAQNQSIAQHQLLTRAPIGTTRTITFRNIDEADPKTVTVTAYGDQYKTYDQAIINWGLVPARDSVESAILEGDIGYLRIATLNPLSDEQSPVDAVSNAMQRMIAEDIVGLILDVRGNRGGLDTLVPPMMGYFTQNQLYYEGIAIHQPLTGHFKQITSLNVKPNELQFTKPVILLVDYRTKSSGEGFGLIAQSLPNVQVMGLHSTDGSFGLTASTVLMPTGITVYYPWGQSVDQSGVVQVEGNHQLQGGISPDIAIPMTFEAAQAIFQEGQDVVLDHAGALLK